MAHLSLSLLGAFRVTLDGRPVADFATDKARALLAYLAVEADRPHRRDGLAALLWPDQPQRKARQNLRQALSFLRQALGDQDNSAPILLVDRETVQLNPECELWLDAVAFEDLMAINGGHRHRNLATCRPCVGRLEQAIELYQGGFLADFLVDDSTLFEEWALLKREWFHRQAIGALGRLARFRERRGDFERARECAWRQVALEPWREESHRQLMRLLAYEGQRSAALSQYETCRRVLDDEFGVRPTAETTALYDKIRDDGYLHAPEPLHNLPNDPTPFVGRDSEIEDLDELLANPDCRLLTLVGPGGIGKSRLALRAGHRQVGAFADGVFFVPLAPLSSADLVPSAIADVLGLAFQDRLDLREQFLSYLKDKEMLLVLDNLEHLMEEVGLLVEILRRCSKVVLLVTSRERANVREEWVYTVSGLTYPDLELENRDELSEALVGCSAIELFVQSAQRANRHFALSEEEIPHVVRICQLVEGMPLGVELAAAWVPVQSIAEIAQELEHSVELLSTRQRGFPERQRSIWATFDHSWQLLSDEERHLFARLSVFHGGFRRDVALEAGDATSASFLGLRDKSLIRQISSDRFDMHELLRQYAAERLQARPQDVEHAQTRHMQIYTAFLQSRESILASADQNQALQDVATEIENARKAWQYAVTHGKVREAEHGLECLYQFHNVRSRFQEGIDLFAQAVDRWRDVPDGEVIFGKTLSRQGALYRHLGNYEESRRCLERGLEIFSRSGMELESAFCLVNLAKVAISQGEYQEVVSLADQGLALSRKCTDSWGISSSLYLLGLARSRTGDVGGAEAHFDESLEIARKSGNPRLILSPLNGLGDIACHRGDYAKARIAFEECIRLSRELNAPFDTAVHLNNLGTVLHVLQDYTNARAYYEESLELCRQIGDLQGQAIALSNLGEIAYALAAPREAYEFYEEGLAIGRTIKDQWTILACLNNLGEIACALGHNEEATSTFAEALRIANETQTATMTINILVNLAVFYAGQDQMSRATLLLSLGCAHPAAERATQEKSSRLLHELGLTLDDNVAGSLDAIVVEILADLDGFPLA
jgi:predicted ATPase/DNA-binding SARP family transcriptional activator